MRPVLWLCAAAAAVLLSHAALAADVKAVLDACDNTEGCGYSISDKSGDISGCSKQTCFYCPNDGKRQCFQVRQHVQTGKPNYVPGPDNLLTNMGAGPAAPTKPKLGTGINSGATTIAPAASE